MELQRLITGAKLGDNEDFGRLVHLFQSRLYASVLAVVKDRDTAEDVVQEAFIRAWTELKSLKYAAAFPSWLWSIALNLSRTRLRQRTKEEKHVVRVENMDVHADEKGERIGASQFGMDTVQWASMLANLKEDQRMLLELRFVASLSLRQIASVMNIGEGLVKSRLYELRQRIKKEHARAVLKPEAVMRTKENLFLEEKIMDKIQALRLGAHVIERLALSTQTRLATVVLQDENFDDETLACIGNIDRGKEFLALYGVHITLPELIGILNHVDRFTEMRLIDHLEKTSPEQAEKIKQNLFVFEDLILFDGSAVCLLASHIGRDIFAIAIKGTDTRTRNHILQNLEADKRKELEDNMLNADGGPNIVRAAQEAVINSIKDLEAAGQLLVFRKGESENGEICITARG